MIFGAFDFLSAKACLSAIALAVALCFVFLRFAVYELEAREAEENARAAWQQLPGHIVRELTQRRRYITALRFVFWALTFGAAVSVMLNISRAMDAR